jgi:hypothetical protein
MRKKKRRYSKEVSDQKADKLLDALTDLFVDDFLARKAEGKLSKPLKHGKQFVQKKVG